MMVPIQFNHQLLLGSTKIVNKIPDWMLAAEPDSFQLI